MSLCQCGCGEDAGVYKATYKERGMIKGQPRKFILNHRSKMTGANSLHWKGGCKSYRHKKYLLRSVNGRQTYEHILIAEKALGKSLPHGSEIHHHNEIQIVICQDHTYHMFLERRERAYKACGHAKWRKCWICKRYDDPANLYISPNGKSVEHRSCRKPKRVRK